jgi:hypothetical protein
MAGGISILGRVGLVIINLGEIRLKSRFHDNQIHVLLKKGGHLGKTRIHH